jgi:hypothetical protein
MSKKWGPRAITTTESAFAKAEENITFKVETRIVFSFDRFWVAIGDPESRKDEYKSAQVRLEGDGTIYVSVQEADRSEILARDLSYDAFYDIFKAAFFPGA